MADNINIGNVGRDDGVASEITLKRLLEANEKIAKFLGADAGTSQRKIRDAYNKSLGTSTKRQAAASAALNTFTRGLGGASNALFSTVRLIGGAFTAAVGSAVGSAVGLSQELLMGGNRIGDFTRHLPILGEQFGAIGYFLDNQVEMYRDLSSQGINFNNSLIEMNRAAIAAEMDLGSFAEIMASSSERMAMFGTNAAGGARAFGELSKNLRTGEVGTQLFRLGFRINDINEGLVSYNVLQSRLGRDQSRNQGALVSGTQDYLEQLDRLARITGTNRKQQEQVMLQNAAEANVAAMMSRLNRDEQENFNNALNMVATTLPGFDNAFKDLADGVAQTDLGQRLASLSPEFAQLAEDAATGRVGQAEFDARMRELIPSLLAFRDEMGAAGVTGLSDLDSGFAALFGSMYQFEEYMSSTFSEAEAAAAQRRRDALTDLGTSFNQTIASVRTQILDKLINNGTIERGITALNNAFTPEKISAFTTNFANFLDEFVEDPKGKMTQVWNDTKEAFMDYFFGEKNADDQRVGGLYDSIKTSFIGMIQRLEEPITTALKDMWRFMLDEIILYLADNTIFFGDAAEEIRKQREQAAALAAATPEEIEAEVQRLATDGVIPESEQTPLQGAVEAQQLEDPQSALNRGFAAQQVSDFLEDYMRNEQTGLMTGIMNPSRISLMNAIEEYRAAGGLFADLPTDVQTNFPDDLKFRRGTGGFRDFGQGTLALLHGEEAVVPRNSPEGQLLTNGPNGATMNAEGISNALREFAGMSQSGQEGVVNAINQLNSTMSRAAAMLAEIERNGKRQISAINASGSTVY